MSNFGTSSLDTEAFEKHSTALLKEVLRGRQRMAAITSKETQLMAHKTMLQQIDKELDPSLYQIIDEVATFIYASDLALFLIAATREGLRAEAEDILDAVRQERRLMSLNDLLSALAETSKMPGTWAASLFGEMDSERDATPYVEPRKASIDLGAMQRGMRI